MGLPQEFPIPQDVKEALSLLERQGRLTPEEVVLAAVDEDSPLHGYFEWDNDRAADRFRLVQARRLIRSVKVRVRTSTTVVKAVRYVRDPSKPKNETGYVSVDQLKREPENMAAVLKMELNRAAAILGRVQDVATALEKATELPFIIAALSNVIEGLAGDGDEDEETVAS